MLFLLAAGCAGPSALQQAEVAPPYSPPAGSIVLRVKVLNVEFTDWTLPCEDAEGCIPSHFWYRYRARVKEVISGNWTEREVEFTHLQHAEYISRVTKDCYVALLPASSDLSAKLGVPFVADKIIARYWDHEAAEIEALRDGS